MRGMKRPSNYRSLRISLHVDFDGVTITDKEHLRDLMKWKGYHAIGRNKDQFENPTEKQLTFAWDELKKSYEVKQPEVKQTEIRYINVSSYSYKRGKKTIYVKEYKRRYRIV